ncbi:MAG: glycosyltransferase family 39 protein [Desulfarculaceae bacterium]|nr:glycosyltransferase family 39 protein [Desulfarculaceae bacterium]MCF8074395.1 glycosyltransferase family 39 protein [Desulfarculaceae bacterium]MCF8103629.1 glycosyltransferase family 39 protein [Desulfarculaceae bacterium]MCF8116042.1 glycosyltransferase family 39 protein [Desulfarculaceae bacterium]
MISTTARRIAILAGLGGFALINLLTLHGGHAAGGDFAQYLIHAKNLMAGLPYRSGIFMPGVHFHNYPPGYPVLLIPMLAWGGMNLVLLKLPGLVFWPLSCWALAAIARRRLGRPSDLYVFLFMLFAPWFFLYKQNILSEAPFICALLAAMVAFLRWQEDGRAWNQWLLWFLLLLAASLLLRSAGVALTGAALLVMVFHKRAWGPAILTIAATVGVTVLQKLMSAGTGGYLAMLSDPSLWFSRVALGLPVKLVKLLGFFLPVYRTGHPLLAVLEALAVLALLVPAAWGWWRWRRQKGGWDLLDAFIVLYLVMVLTWPFVEGPRLYAPIAGLLVIYFLEGLREFLAARQRPWGGKTPQDWLKVVLLAGLVLNLGNTALLWNQQSDMYLRPPDRELYAWVRQHAGPGHTYVYAYPRVMALFSGRVGQKFYPGSPLGPQAASMPAQGIAWLILPRPEAMNRIPSARRQFSWLFFGKSATPQKVLAQAEADPNLEKVWQNQNYEIFARKKQK